MSSFVGYLIGVTALLTFIGVALQSLDRFVEDSDKENMRRAVVRFWLSTAELNNTESVGAAIRARYYRMKRSIPRFMRLFWLMLLMMFLIICTENYERSADELEKDYTSSTTIDFLVLANTYYIEAERDLSLFCAGRYKECHQFGSDLAWRHEVSRIAQLESSYKDLLTEFAKNNAVLLRIAADATAALVILLLAIPLSLSLLLSFNCTLWLLSSITSSSWKLIAIVFIDIFLALIISGYIA